MASVLQFELPLNESQTSTFKNPLSSISALHTSQTDTYHSIPIKLKSSYTKYEERKSALKKNDKAGKLITSNEVIRQSKALSTC